MPKSKKGSGKIEPVQVSQQLYARAYAARLAKHPSESSSRPQASAAHAIHQGRDAEFNPLEFHLVG
jgi:hypothetical protein